MENLYVVIKIINLFKCLNTVPVVKIIYVNDRQTENSRHRKTNKIVEMIYKHFCFT